MSDYDVDKTDWGMTAEEGWQVIAERQWLEGAFIWTGFDYRGEPTPYEWPCINSHFGILDVCGFPKNNFWHYQSMWFSKEEHPVAHVFPHWNKPVVDPVPVWAYSNGDFVELFVNGVSHGRQKMKQFSHAEWRVPYQQGSIKLVAFNASGNVIAQDTVETTGEPYAISLEAELVDRNVILADNQDVAPVKVSIVEIGRASCRERV